ncbi:phosphoglycolate phosphatase [Polymorphum gilvum]|uniref:Phosphoglycolate phosphatase n=1 Tax=Polymorphum gilvum (strain LMG 25793 / CGMCC 1.9160 / SL003B-26A1) TaxID=991905 RepID=F2IXT2_POLGS|nr:phosphoglycolate phosphatase [Polymorphum gilvum]ADZ69413.1 Phosphoglycolate phosphatase, bacterial [Polymorphum gilvum SL003B-26A1]
MRAVVFDLDGTLVDSVAAIADIGNTLVGELGLAPLCLDEARGYIGNGAAKFVERALAARGRTPTGADLHIHVERFETLYAAAPGDANRPFPGVEATLRLLKARGVALGLCTNKPGAPTTNLLAALGWSELFAAVVTGDTLAQKKPDPAPLHHCARLLGHAAAGGHIAYVGDSEVDAATAEAAGAPFLLYTEGYRKAPVEALPHRAAFSDYGRLPELLDALFVDLAETR